MQPECSWLSRGFCCCHSCKHSYYCCAKSCSSCYCCCSHSYFSRVPRYFPVFRSVSCPHVQPHENLAHTRQVQILSSPSITGLICTNNPTAEEQRKTVPKISFPLIFTSPHRKWIYSKPCFDRCNPQFFLAIPVCHRPQADSKWGALLDSGCMRHPGDNCRLGFSSASYFKRYQSSA